MSTTDANAPKGGRQFLFLITTMACLTFFFVWKQWELVTSPVVFFVLIILLIFTAFWASATEAAFTVITASAAYKAIFDDITKMQTNLASELAPIDAKDSLSLSRGEERQRAKILSKSNRLGIKRRALNGEMRDEFVGALSAFSVFLNTALAAFLPLTVAAAIGQPLLHIPYPVVTFGNPGINISASDYAFVAPKLLIFISSAIPVLILGKIVPKMVGFKHPNFFAYRHYWFGRMVQITLGWIALGTKWPVSKLLG